VKKIDVSNIRAIGITNQRETVVAWNKITGQVYHNAIVWSDVRTKDICERRKNEAGNNINFYKKINGLPISTYFSAFKIQWLLENVPDIRKNYDQVAFGTIDSFLLYVIEKAIKI
jgi:glycerol kinase